ncbi:DUF3500 domain-containing protein [Actinoplanes subtropicus]|uniref:DUF3500 domain-containing protein n=1 Tax=Actinoplanes subtropicus TaxID=543632 RepID=UPI0004C41F9D|nr:DUF3500 domain-containing protein [Actinoplanes subtropicus]
MNKEAGQHARPSRRRWRGAAVAAAAVLLVGGGYATANAATAKGASTKPAAARPQVRGTGVAAVVNAANAFLATLSDDQKAQVLLDFSQANATNWSNLPEGIVTRVGIQLGTLDDEQLAAAKAVVKAATGTGKGTGFDQVTQILKADDILAAAEAGSTSSATADPSVTATADPTDSATAEPTDTATADPSASASDAPTGTPPSGGPGGGGGLNYGSGIYFLSFLGTPSLTGTWQLHFGGHHLALNITFKDGKVTGSTPFFIGVEPTSFTTDGTTYQPLSAQRDGMLKLLGSLTTAQQATAKLTESFGDVLLGPGQDGQFPTTKEGIAVSQLSPAQKKLVLAAMRPWVSMVDNATTRMLLTTYEKQLNQTFVAFSGGTGLDTQGDYVRIDGPGVWIEFICQNGIVFQSQIHFHTVYRDHTRDYGGEFTF